jgi:hypothetical protein
MWWIPYTALLINLVVIWLMPKRLSKVEIYAIWFVTVCINFSTDIVLAIYFDLYELAGEGIQLGVHLLEWTLSPSYGIIFLNFLPRRTFNWILYLIGWTVYSVLFEALLVNVDFVVYSGWKLWYSAIYYLLALLFVRWQLHFIRRLGK